MELIAGIDIGGTKLAVGIGTRKGKLLAQARKATEVERGPSAILEDLVTMVLQTLQEVRFTYGEGHLIAVGVGCGGPLDRQKGTVIEAPNLPGWAGFPVQRYFEERLQVPVLLDNDANAAALAEARLGAGLGHSHVAYFTVSTGIGGGIVINGHLYRGASDGAGEFGHQILLPEGPQCLCGKWGCLEALASGTSIARRAREELAKGETSALLEKVGGDLSLITAHLIAETAQEGDPLARKLFEEAGYYLGLGIANVINILNPSIVILGGGVIKAGSLILEPAVKTAKERAMTALAEKCEIVPAQLGDDVGVYGALCLGIELLENQETA